MNDNQVILSLLNFYKNEGIDLHYLLDDPLFVKLPLSLRIEMIKNNAKQIHQGMSGSMTRRDWNVLGKDMLFQGILGGMTGAAAAATTAKLFVGGKIAPAAIALAVSSGVGSGLGLSLLRNYGRTSERKNLRTYVEKVVENPSDQAAFDVIVKRNLQRMNRTENSAPFNKFLSRIDTAADERAKNIAIKETVRENTLAGRDWAAKK